MTPRRGLVLAGILALASVGVARAQETEAERAFVRDFVAALNSQSLERRLVLVHPGARTCTAGEVGEWWREAVVRQARDQVPEVVRTSIAELGRALPFADRFDYPVAPTHQLQLDYALPGNRSRTIVVLLARDGARWTEVVPCARADTVAAIAAKRAERAKEAERIKALAARTSPELRTSVVKLYRAGRRVDAFQAYIQASGEDLATAKAVVELLAEGSP